MAKPFPEAESIRVVPVCPPKTALKLDKLLTKDNAPVATTTKFTYRGGPLLANVEVFTIFWGTGWSTAPLADTATTINKFFTTILKGGLMAQMSEYSTPKYKIGNGRLTGNVIITAGAPKQTITDTQIQTQLQKWIQTDKRFPKPNANSLYFLYLDNGVSVTMGGSKSCSSFCGYHNSINKNIFYAVMPYPSCSGCQGGLAAKDSLTATSSHELCEAITDPVPGSGWYEDNNGEIGDICAWKFKTLDGFKVQLEWSNKQNKCI